MNILAIESSCDETAVAIVRDGREVLCDCIASQVALHREYGGVVPEIASRKHMEAIYALADQALAETGLKRSDIDAVAVTYAPGLIGAVLVGVNFAKAVALALGKPLIPVHHIRGHIAANYLAFPALKPPFLCLVVSGGHTHLVTVEDYTKFTLLGRTRDDAAGECFDKAARAMGLPYPGGVHMDQLAKKGDPTAYTLPHPKVDGSALDFSFSGLKTAVLNLLHNARQKGLEISLPDLAASFQHTVVEILCDHTLQAAAETNAKTVVLAGGVSANSELRAAMQQRCEQMGIRLCYPPLPLCGDNAAMVGAQAYYEFCAGNTATMQLNAVATLPIEN